MSLIIPAGYGQATFVHQCAGVTKESVWTIGFKELSFTSAAESAENAYNHFTTGDVWYNPDNFSNQWTFLGVRVTYVTESGIFTGQFLDPVVGGNSLAPVPINSAILVRKNTALGGRKYRGRMFVPPFTPAEANVTASGVIGDSQRNSIQTTLNTATDAWNGTDVTLYLLHSDSTLPTEITSLAVQSQLATQRRRMR